MSSKMVDDEVITREPFKEYICWWCVFNDDAQ